MKYRRIFFELLPGAILLLSTTTFIWAGEPGELVKKVILKDISLKDGEDTKERKQKLWRKISPSFNFEEMAKSAMGIYWKERSHEEKMEFVELFANNIKGAYMRKSGPRFGERIISLNEEQDDDSARVKVRLLKRTNENVSAVFCLIRKNGEWGICDVIFEGVSLASNYRRQINSFMTGSSYKDLVQVFKQRQGKE